jgi:hypothetical protein
MAGTFMILVLTSTAKQMISFCDQCCEASSLAFPSSSVPSHGAMGVHGLTTYLRENRRTLATAIELSQQPTNDSPKLSVVIDGWSYVRSLRRI